MFYSQDFLGSTQYGVATVWLAATVGRGSLAGKATLRRLTRKAVQKVNIPKTCEQILDPHAPLALRLQGSLLYGLSRVFSRQCAYMLSDAEKIQSDMMTFFRALQTSEIDPRAGKTKRHLITLQDDPGFDLINALPSLHLLDKTEADAFYLCGQGSASRFSLMTPCSGPRGSDLSSIHDQSLITLELPPSSASARSYRLPSELGLATSPLAKPDRRSAELPEFHPFDHGDDMDQIEGVDLDFDADGNLIGILDPEQALPSLAHVDETRENALQPHPADAAYVVAPGSARGARQGYLNVGEDPLPDAEAFSSCSSKMPNQNKATSYFDISEDAETESTIANKGSRKRRRRRPALYALLDPIDRVSHREFRSWTENYVRNMVASRQQYRLSTPAQARKIALTLLYGNRIAGIGSRISISGISHPLAEDFSGSILKAHLHELDPDEIETDALSKRVKRRKSDEGAEMKEFNDGMGGRNVRRRLDEDAERGRGEEAGVGHELALGDDSMPEAGLDQPLPLDERHSSSAMPWSRPSSVLHGHGSAQKTRTAPSPLHSRHSVIGSIERHSDPPDAPIMASEAFDSGDTSLQFEGTVGTFEDGHDPVADLGLELSSLEFLDYAKQQATDGSMARNDEGAGRCWIAFDRLADPAIHSKAVAAQAFLHILSLATSKIIVIEQDGIEEKQAFGNIRLGLRLPV